MIVEPQWIPTEHDLAAARITDYTGFVAKRTGFLATDYHSLWKWSVDNLDAFWRSIWDYFELGPSVSSALSDTDMPGAQWFPGARVNYVDQIARHGRSDRTAIVYVGEDGAQREIAWTELIERTAALAVTLRAVGVSAGDRVVAYMPNIAETVIAFLATASIGAVWSACGQDYSVKAALDRFGQLDPVVLVTADGYRFGGKTHDRSREIDELRTALSGLVATIQVSRFGATPEGVIDWLHATAGAPELRPTQVGFDHPLWVVFSSGTTGLPKGIVHGHGGVVLEHLKTVALHLNIGSEDTLFW
ncbi:MAG: AMP-binding protein, partial [Mycobacterium sp.]